MVYQWFQNSLKQLLGNIQQYHQLTQSFHQATQSASDPAMAYINWGIQLAEDGNLSEAAQKFEQATVIDPQRAEGFTNWGVALAKQQQLPEAIERFEHAARLAPANSANMMLWAAALVQLNRLDEAEALYQKAVALDPENPESYLSWGMVLAKLGRYPQAIEQFRRSVAVQSYQPEAYFLWGAVLAECQQYEAALEKFNATLRYEPKHQQALYLQSVCHSQLGQYDEAIRSASNLLNISQADKKNAKPLPEIYILLGNAHTQTGRVDLAIANYQEALRLDPDCAEARLGWGLVCLQQHDLTAAWQQLQVLIESSLEPSSSDTPSSCDPLLRQQALSHWAKALVQAGRFAEALPYCQQAAESFAELKDLEPDLNLLLTWSLALAKTQQPQAATQKLKQVENQPKLNANAHYLLGTHYWGLDQSAEAQAHFEQALALNPDFDLATISLSMLLVNQQQTLDALRLMRALYRKKPQQPKVVAYYALALAQHGQAPDALEKYQQALALAPEDIEIALMLTEFYLQNQQPLAAQALLERILAKIPQHPQALQMQQQFQEQLNDAET